MFKRFAVRGALYSLTTVLGAFPPLLTRILLNPSSLLSSLEYLRTIGQELVAQGVDKNTYRMKGTSAAGLSLSRAYWLYLAKERIQIFSVYE